MKTYGHDELDFLLEDDIDTSLEEVMSDVRHEIITDITALLEEGDCTADDILSVLYEWGIRV